MIEGLVDPFGRTVDYVRVSVTERCDFRCVYCMSEDMTFLPKSEVLSLEEMERLCSAFIDLGVRKIRVTGGEPLVRRNVMTLFQQLGRHLENGKLDELTVTTNGSQLARYATDLYASGIRRINVSLDTLNSDKFLAITRWGKFDRVIAGINAAQDAGLKVKINVVALKNFNEDELGEMIAWCGAQNLDMTLIEAMPMGDIGNSRFDQHLSLANVRQSLEKDWTLQDINYRTGGPASYVTVIETGRKLGFITPLSHNFCEACNRVRLTCTGTLFMCLGQEDAADLRLPLRTSPNDSDLRQVIREAISRKPKGHDFVIDRDRDQPAIDRHMSVTGG